MAQHTPELQLELEKLNACIHCGMCLPACPTYQVTGSEAESPRGRLYLMRAMLEGELESSDQLTGHLDQCLACHACETACPSGVAYGDLLLASREQLASRDRSPGRWFRRWVFRRVLPNHGLLIFLARLLRFYQQSGLQALIRASHILRLIPPLARQESLLPAIPVFKKLSAGMTFGASPAHGVGKRVLLFTGCVMDVFYNPVHWATIKVLVKNNYQVIVPDQTCCGALAHHAGETDITRLLAKENVRKLMGENPDWIVVNSGGCGSTLKAYGELMAADRVDGPQAEVFAQKTVDVMELLAKQPLAPFDKPVHKTVTYHASCHLHHVQKVQGETRQLLQQLPGLTLAPLTDYDTCCGSAGIYNLTHPELADDILAIKTDHLKKAYEASGADTVVTGNPGCLLQIEKGLVDAGIAMTVCHPVELLAEGYL